MVVLTLCYATCELRQCQPIANRTDPSSHRGQLEWFSSDATGLGDLEAADQAKRMLRQLESKHLKLKSSISKRIKASNEHFNQPQLEPEKSELFAVQRIPTVDSQLGPILIARRTEELISPEQDSSPELLEDFPLMGEFGSRISLLTTRKMEPNFLAAASAAARGYTTRNKSFKVNIPKVAEWIGEQSDDIVPVPSRALLDPNASIGEAFKEMQNEDSQSNSNFLPRIARALM